MRPLIKLKILLTLERIGMELWWNTMI